GEADSDTSYERRRKALRSASRNGSSSSRMSMRMNGLCLGVGQGDARPAALRGFHAHLAAFPLHHVAGQVESQSGALPGFLGGEERLSQAAQKRLGHANAVVGHGEMQLVVGVRQRNAQLALGPALGGI